MCRDDDITVKEVVEDVNDRKCNAMQLHTKYNMCAQTKNKLIKHACHGRKMCRERCGTRREKAQRQLRRVNNKERERTSTGYNR